MEAGRLDLDPVSEDGDSGVGSNPAERQLTPGAQARTSPAGGDQPPGEGALSPAGAEPLPPGARPLGPEDRVSELLLHRVARHTLYEHMGGMAADLGVTAAQLSFIRADFPAMAEHQVFQVLYTWNRKCAELPTRVVLDLVVGWVRRGAVADAVWAALRPLVRCELPVCAGPAETPAHARSAQDAASPASGILSNERLHQIREWTKESLLEKPFSTAKGKIWTETPTSIPLDRIYTKLSVLRKQRLTYDVGLEEVDDVTRLLSDEQLGGKDAARILVTGSGGIGKSTALRQMAVTWAHEASPEVSRFHFLFHVALRNVSSDVSVATLIVDEHPGLVGNDVAPEEIQKILDGQSAQTGSAQSRLRVLILLDGYDEYKAGTNAQIDKTIRKSALRRCCVLLTSRDVTALSDVRDHVDVEAQITGFDWTRVVEYTTKYLGSQERAEAMLAAVRERGVAGEADADARETRHGVGDAGLLNIPILLHMICVLFLRKVSLPGTRTGIIGAIVERCPGWERQRRAAGETPLAAGDGGPGPGGTASPDLGLALRKLGDLALTALRREQHLFSKEEVLEAVGPDAFALGLLMGTEGEESLAFSFHHRLLQEFTAGRVVARMDEASLRRLFPTWPDVMRHHEVLRFAVGLSGHPSSASSGHPSSASSGHPSSATNGGPFPLLTFLYSSLVTHVTTQTHFPKSMLDPEVPFLRAVVCEAPDVLRDFDPIHNEFINYMSASSASLYDLYVSHQAALDVIHVPSRLYVFGPDVDYARLTFDVKSRGFGGATAWEEARCVASLENHVSAMLSFLTTLRKISAHQVVRIAYLDSANSRAYPMEKVKDVPKLLRETQRLGPDARILSLTQRPSEHLKAMEMFPLPVSELLPAALRGCARTLVTLRLRGLSELPADLPEVLTTFTSLKHVDLSDSSVKSAVYRALAKALKGKTAVEELVLRNTNKVPAELGEALETMTSLRVVSLARCGMRADVGEAVLEGLSHCAYLETLDLSNNNLTSGREKLFGGREFPRGFPRLRELHLGLSQMCTRSYLSFFTKGKDDFNPLGEALQRNLLPSLKNLDLSASDLTGLLPDIMAAPLPKLTTLNLATCKVAPQDIEALTAAVRCGKLPRLTYIDLGHCESACACLGELEGMLRALLGRCCGETGVTVRLVRSSLPREARERLRDVCRGAHVDLLIL